MNYQKIENKLVEFAHAKEGKEYPIHEVSIDTAVEFAIQQVKNCSIPHVSNSLDLRELERKLDEALGKETRETLTEWLKQQRL